MPITITGPPFPRRCSRAHDGEIEEVGGAADARVVVADRHLAPMAEIVIGQAVAVHLDHVLGDMSQVVLDGRLVL
jgi:hypothetical protein